MTNRVEEVADELVGTCKSLHDVTTEEEQDDDKFCESLSDLVFCCEICSWWFLTEEMHNDDGVELCPDCNEAEE